MNWRWLIWDFADPDLPLTWRQRIRTFFRPVWIGNLPRGTVRGRVWFALCMMLLGFACMAAMIALVAAVRGPLSLSVFLLWFVLMMLVLWIGGAAANGLCCRRENYHRVRLDGYEVCMKCGYWLRGLDEDAARCPECGTEREPMPEVKA